MCSFMCKCFSVCSHLNPTSPSSSPIPSDVRAEFLRGAVTSVMATWECFVDNLLSECFDVVVNYTGHDHTDTCSSNSSSEGSISSAQDKVELRKLRKRWPNCQPVLQNAIKRRAIKMKKPPEVITFEIMMENRPHLTLLMEHKKESLKGILPLLLGEGGIEEAFNTLFAIKRVTKGGKHHTPSLSDHLASLPTLVEYTYILPPGLKVQLRITSVETMNDILRLYYGTRCVIAHGVAAKTVTEGCLHNFPSVEELQRGMSNKSVAEEMCGLLRRLQQNGREVVLSYLELCMMYRFFRCLANRLMIAVAMGVSGISKKQPRLWQHKLYMQKEEIYYDSGWMMTSSPVVQPSPQNPGELPSQDPGELPSQDPGELPPHDPVEPPRDGNLDA